MPFYVLLPGQKSPQSVTSPPSGENSKLSNDNWKRGSYYFGQSPDNSEAVEKDKKVTHFSSETKNYSESKQDRISRTSDRRGSPESAADSYLRVQSEPPLVKGQTTAPQPIREEIFHETAKVRRLYPTVERKNSRQTRLVYRSESKREPKR